MLMIWRVALTETPASTKYESKSYEEYHNSPIFHKIKSEWKLDTVNFVSWSSHLSFQQFWVGEDNLPAIIKLLLNFVRVLSRGVLEYSLLRYFACPYCSVWCFSPHPRVQVEFDYPRFLVSWILLEAWNPKNYLIAFVLPPLWWQAYSTLLTIYFILFCILQKITNTPRG